MPKARAKTTRHSLERLSATTWRVVEKDDPYQQYCQCYVRLAPEAKRCFLIDTGCGLGNLRDYIEENINLEKWPYTVICTHSHFDHIAANHLFAEEEIYFGAADQAFVNNNMDKPMPLYDGTFMGRVIPFPVTRWLKDGDLISLNGSSHPPPEASLQVIFTPGHSPDSISLYDPQERRLFCGDFLYPAAAWDDPLSPPGGLYAMSKGSDLSTYQDALLKLQSFLKSKAEPEGSITLACGHNTYCLDIGFLTSAIDLLEAVQKCELPPRPVNVFGYQCLEFVLPADRRASVVVPAA